MLNGPFENLENFSNSRPLFLNLELKTDKSRFELLCSHPKTNIFDTIELQIADLLHVRDPASKYEGAILAQKVIEHIQGKELLHYGSWVYYPWSHRLVHLLPQAEFIEVRTNRNLHKITVRERDLLSEKRIGIIGLSVGQSVALTMALERMAGELVIADYDTLDLSNLNRIRAGVHQLGVSKVEIVAREIAEIDPYLKVTCFTEGITTDNIDAFFSQPRPLDLLVDECDSLNIKIEARRKARKMGIPVLMDTSDRGMLDVERYEIEPSRKLFHGLLGEMEDAKFDGITPEQRLAILARVVGVDSVSSRLKASVLEMGFTTRAWPQLASAVALGGAVVTDAARRILLGECVVSGRYYIDVAEKIIKAPVNQLVTSGEDLRLLQWQQMQNWIEQYRHQPPQCVPEMETIERLVECACAAPSSGNNQPWKWYYKGGLLFLFIDKMHTQAFGDFKQIPTYISLGAALENLAIAAHQEGLGTTEQAVSPSEDGPVYIITFSSLVNKTIENPYYPYIFKRKTERSLHYHKPIETEVMRYIENLVISDHPKFTLQVESRAAQLNQLGSIVAEMDVIRLLNKRGHHDFFHSELRWTTEQAMERGDGIDLPSLHLSSADKLGVRLLSDPDTAKVVADLNGGQKLLENSQNMLANTASVIFLSCPDFAINNFLEGGKLMQKIWLYCTSQNIAVHPIVSPLYFFYRHLHGDNEGLDEKEVKKIEALRIEFLKIFTSNHKCSEIMMLRIGYCPDMPQQTIRRSMNEVLKFDNI